MALDPNKMLALLKFELRFLEDGGYGRSPRAPWRPPYIFEDSPTCPNFGDPSRPQSCGECLLMQIAPVEVQSQNSSCRSIPLNEKGETLDDLYRWGTQFELEEAVAHWLRARIVAVEQLLPTTASSEAKTRPESSKLAGT